jgi:hypothetical protein
MASAEETLMSTLRFLSLAVVLSATACVGGSEEEPSPVQETPDETADEHPPEVLAPNFNDGLGALLDAEEPEPPPVTEEPPPDPAKKPTCDATAKGGDYCGNDKVSFANANTLYHCTGPGVPATVVKVCAAGCVVAPAGSDDYCKSTSTSGSASADACPHVSTILKWGLHPKASDRLRCVGITAARITQTIGSAAASAGTHAQDGTVDGQPYSAATDLSVSGLTDAQVKTLIARLDAIGFAAFFRKPCSDGWPCSEARHVHVVFAGAAMKSSLRAQISDFLAGKNGLASHTTYSFYQPPADVKAYVKKIFDAAN